MREASGQGLGPAPGFVRATAPISRFVVVRRDAEQLTARITLRAAGEMNVIVNGMAAGRVAARREWTTSDLVIALNRGRNLIELHWPPPQPDAAAEFERAARRLERGLYPEVLVAFGELHAFTAS